MSLPSKRKIILQNTNDIEQNDWSSLLNVLQGIGFDAVHQFATDYIENCDEQSVSKIHSTTVSIDSLLPTDVIAYCFQFLFLKERLKLSILGKFYANLMQSNSIWNDARIHVFPSDGSKNKFYHNNRIQINYDSSESPCVMVPSFAFGNDRFKFLSIIEYLCINVHEWNSITAWNALKTSVKYLYLTHNDQYTPSFDFLNAGDHTLNLKYLRIDLSSSYNGVISLELPSNLEALSISCLMTHIHSWSYLAQSMVSKLENITMEDSSDWLFGNPNKETLLSMNVFMQQKFQNIKFLKLCDCNFVHQFEIQSILDSCNKLEYLSLVRVEWKDNRLSRDTDDDVTISYDPDIIIPSTVVGLCLIDSCLNVNLEKCKDTLWEIGVNIKSLTFSKYYGGIMNETQLLQRISVCKKGLQQLILFGQVSTQSLKLITSKLNNGNNIRYVISDKIESGMNRYWSKKFGCMFTRNLNPLLCENDYDLLKGIKNKTTMFDSSLSEAIPWQYYSY